MTRLAGLYRGGVVGFVRAKMKTDGIYQEFLEVANVSKNSYGDRAGVDYKAARVKPCFHGAEGRECPLVLTGYYGPGYGVERLY